MVNQLSAIDVTEISLVPAPAVPSAQTLLAKNAGDMTAAEGVRRIVAIAKSDRPGTLNRDTYLWALRKGAEDSREPRETEAQAFARYASTEDGKALYAAHRQAPKDTEDGIPSPSDLGVDGLTRSWSAIVQAGRELQARHPAEYQTTEQAIRVYLLTDDGRKLWHPHRVAQAHYQRMRGQ
jgi:hypothetical protein